MTRARGRSSPARFLIRVGALASKEIIHIRRDIRTLYMALGMPVVLLLLFGYAMSFDIDALPMAVLDDDRTPTSRELVQRFTASDDFHLAGEIGSAEEAEALFRRYEIAAALVIPAGFERDLMRGEHVTVQLLMDGADANTTNIARGKAEALAQAAGLEVRQRVVSASGASGGLDLVVPPPQLALTTWTRFNPQNRSALFLIPGLIAVILALVGVMLTALTVAREWERGNMEQLFATPVGRLEIVIGKLLPYMVIGCIAVLLALTVGAWVFDVPIRGSLTLLAVDSLLFITGMLGLGLLISVTTRNQMLATQVAALSSMLPTMLLSNFIFPVENMPWILRWLSYVLPATYYIEALRGTLLRGNGWAELWHETLALAVFAVLMVVISTARFKRRLA
jgi:ABC-2 type transport system permease protein